MHTVHAPPQCGETRTILLPERSGVAEESMIRKAIPRDDDSWNGCHVRMDFAQVEYVSSEDLGALVAVHQRLARLGGRLTLLNVRKEVLEVLRITHLHRLLEIQP